METVQFTTEHNLCISCGVCEGICTKNCITMVRNNGMFIPRIGDNCIHCGMCFKACPGKGIVGSTAEEINVDDLMGTYMFLYNAWSKDGSIRHNAASGGVTSTLIQYLLERQMYDVAFVVKDFAYDKQIHSEPVYSGHEVVNFIDDTHLVTKSRYVPIGHDYAVKYIIENPTKKVILVGSPCAIRGILNVVEIKKLNRNNYLLIGLFCESVMNYNVWNYFSGKKFSAGKGLTALHFKNKESVGWPGNMKLLFVDGSYKYYDKSYRMEVKPYFKPERCIYCVDKLNVNADISLGDNYTGVDDSELGSNTVIVRSQIGLDAWKYCESELEVRQIDRNHVIFSQLLEHRIRNIEYADFKQRNIKNETGINLDINSLGKRGSQLMNLKQYTAEMNNMQIGGVQRLSA